MKSIKTQLQRAFSLCIALQIVAVIFMTIPQLEGTRTSLAEILGLSTNLLWLPITALLAIAFFGVLKALGLVVAKPIESLARHARDGESANYVFQKKSVLDEKNTLKRVFEKQSSKVKEVEDLFEDLTTSLKQANEQVATHTAQSERQSREIEQYEQSQYELRVINQSLSAENETLQSTLNTERKTKVGREVKMRAEEIYSQMERAVAQASARSIWIPNLIEQLKAPTEAIANLAQNLESNWQKTSIEQISEEIAEISLQSDLQRELLGNLSPEKLLASVPESAPILEPEAETEPNPTIEAPEAASEPEPIVEETPSFEIPADKFIEETPKTEAVESVTIEDEPTYEAIIESAETESEISIPEPEPIELVQESIPAINENSSDQAIEEVESLTALQSLVFELVSDYSKEVEGVSIDADFEGKVDLEVDEELLESVLSNLLEIAIYQWREGSVKLNISRNDNEITFAVNSKGKPLAYGEFDETQTNRIESALDRKISVDMPSENELRMRYKYTPEEN
ncbi:MAG: hypothetical protein ACKVGW_21530 [Verrucomicrobiia bacterium]